MPRKIKPANPLHVIALAECLARLKQARAYAVKADCPQTARAIRAALKSADGAMRHMRHRLNRMESKS